MANLLTAVQTIVTSYDRELGQVAFNANRMNAMGTALEDFIKDAFADAFDLEMREKQQRYSDTFSYTGNQNNPPDMMLKLGDAIEVKKIERLTNAIALNSSYPKDKLFANSPMITDACRNCEQWTEKDLIYAIGTVENKTHIKHLWLIYGDCFIANASVYERIKNTISLGVNSIEHIEFTPSTELGKVKKVDPLGITDLRIRGMWSIQNPSKVFAYLHPITLGNTFQLSCLLTLEKFTSFPLKDQQAILAMQSDHFVISDVEIQNPNNPAQRMAAKLLHFKAAAR